MEKTEIPDDAFSDEGEMTLEQAKILLDFIMENQKEKDIQEHPKLKLPAQYVDAQEGILPPNLRCMGTSAKAMQERIRREAEKTAFMLHASEVNASKALPPQ